MVTSRSRYAMPAVALAVVALVAPAAPAPPAAAQPAAANFPTVYGGAAADLAQTDWFAAWLPGRGGRCGGAVIAKRWIVTAAHCVSSAYDINNLRVRINPAKRVDDVRSGIKVDRVIVHPKFVNNGRDLPNDIALLHVATDLPGPRLALNTDPASPAKGAALRVYGFGATSKKVFESKVLQVGTVADLTGPTGKTCGSYPAGRFNPSRQVCAGGSPQIKVDACPGDSGGPLVATRNGKLELVGVVSHGGDACNGDPAQPGIYTRVSAYGQWIKDALTGPNFVLTSAPGCSIPDDWCDVARGGAVKFTLANPGGKVGTWKAKTSKPGLVTLSATSGKVAAKGKVVVTVRATAAAEKCTALTFSGQGLVTRRYSLNLNGHVGGC